MRELADFLSRRTQTIDLDSAALQLAAIEYPDLDIRASLATLDALAGELSTRLTGPGDGSMYVSTANQYLFDELGFHGNEEDYYNPRNSCLNDVLALRIGIPITLSIVYMEIARRLGRPVYGIGLPGHFLVQYDDGRFSAYIDVFRRGTLLTPQECRELSRQITGELPGDPIPRPVDKRHILVRMLNNLRAVYFRRRAYRKALQTLDLLIPAIPNSPEEYKQRGALHSRLGQYKAAAHDFETYLRLAPESPEREQIEHQIAKARRSQASLN